MNTLAERLTQTIGTAQARVLAPQKEDTPTVDMEAINAHALKPLTEDEIFAFQFELSNSNVDAYFTRMTKETLDNYASRINTAGVPLQPNHDSYTFPIGRMYHAEVIQTDDGVNRLMCDCYIVRGDENGDSVPSGDALIRKVETGVQKDVSIGFNAGGYTCSICGQDMVPGFFGRVMGDECDHIPGAMYDGKTCYAWVEDGIILEGSLVYTGATPQAIIQKAMNAHRLGKLSTRMINSVSNALNIKLVTEDTPMKAKELLTRVAAVKGISEGMKRSLEEQAQGLNDEGEDRGAEVIGEHVAKVESEKAELEKENNSLKAEAADGKAYREELVTAAVEDGVRAIGEDYKKEDMEKMIRALPLDQVKAMRSHYQSMIAKLGETVNRSQDEKIELSKVDAKEAPVLVDTYK